MKSQDPHEWWAKRAAYIAVLMENTGVGELIIRRKPDGKYSFEITPEADAVDDTGQKCAGLGYLPGACSGCNGTGKKSLWQMYQESLHNADGDARPETHPKQSGG